VLTSRHFGLNRISSSYRQLSEIVTPKSLVELRHMGSRWKAEKVIYDIGIEGLLRLHLNLGQKFRFLRTLNSVQNKILAAQQISKNHKS
jgi:hypothetical protein